MKIFSVIISLFIQTVIWADACVEIKPKYEGDGKYYIWDADKKEKLANFQIKIKESSSKSEDALTLKKDGNLVFHIRLINIESEKKDDDSDKIDVKDLYINDGSNLKNVKQGNRDSHIHSDVIEIVVPKDQLSNERFHYSVKNQIVVYLNNQQMQIDDLQFEIIPVLSIEFEDGTQERTINFGKITYDNEYIRSEEKHNFELKYTCITEPQLEVSSKNDFNLAKLKNGEILDKIPYRLCLNINGKKVRFSGDESQLLTFILQSNPVDFTNYITGKCYIKTPIDHIPLAGRYNDTVTFTIKP